MNPLAKQRSVLLWDLGFLPPKLFSHTPTRFYLARSASSVIQIIFSLISQETWKETLFFFFFSFWNNYLFFCCLLPISCLFPSLWGKAPALSYTSITHTSLELPSSQCILLSGWCSASSSPSLGTQVGPNIHWDLGVSVSTWRADRINAASVSSYRCFISQR